MNPHLTTPQGDDVSNDKNYKIYLIVGIVIIALMPIILTRNAWIKAFDFSSTGPIGDTIGGITAPFVGILGAILVYISFNEQRKANRIQAKSLDDEKKRIESQNNFELLYRFYLEEIKNYEFPKFPTNEVRKILSYSPEPNENPSMRYKYVIKITREYIDLINFFLENLLQYNISKVHKVYLIKLYHKSIRRLRAFVVIPDTKTKEFEYIRANFPQFTSLYLRSLENMNKIDIENLIEEEE